MTSPVPTRKASRRPKSPKLCIREPIAARAIDLDTLGPLGAPRRRNHCPQPPEPTSAETRDIAVNIRYGPQLALVNALRRNWLTVRTAKGQSQPSIDVQSWVSSTPR